MQEKGGKEGVTVAKMMERLAFSRKDPIYV